MSYELAVIFSILLRSSSVNPECFRERPPQALMNKKSTTPIHKTFTGCGTSISQSKWQMTTACQKDHPKRYPVSRRLVVAAVVAVVVPRRVQNRGYSPANRPCHLVVVPVEHHP